MPDPVIINRATSDEGDGPFAVIQKLFNSVFARLHALEMKPTALDGRPGRDGKDADPELIRRIAAEEAAKVIAAQPKRKRVTKVTRWDEKGRIAEFEQEEE